MKLVTKGAAFILAASWAIACAAPTDEETNGDGDGDTGVTPATGGTTGTTTGGTTGTTTGGTTGTTTGGTTGTGTGGVPATGTGGTPPVGSGGSAPVGMCASTAPIASPPAFTAWDTQDGVTRVDLDASTTIAGPASTTIVNAAMNDPYVAVAFTPWVESGPRACVDVSAHTGVSFDLTADVNSVIFKIGIAATNADSSHPEVVVTPGTGVQVPFDSVMPATWGTMAPLDKTQVIKMIWTSADRTAGRGITVSNVAVY